MTGPITIADYGVLTDNYLDASFAKLVQTQNAGIVQVTNTVANVKSTIQANPGQYICVDGAFSDVQCNGTVDVRNYRQCMVYTDGKRSCNLIQVNSQNGKAIAGQGDSGAPVFESSLYPPGSADPIYAAGILSGGSGVQPCPQYQSGRTCFTTIEYTDLGSINSYFKTYTKTN